MSWIMHESREGKKRRRKHFPPIIHVHICHRVEQNTLHSNWYLMQFKHKQNDLDRSDPNHFTALCEKYLKAFSFFSPYTQTHCFSSPRIGITITFRASENLPVATISVRINVRRERDNTITNRQQLESRILIKVWSLLIVILYTIRNVSKRKLIFIMILTISLFRLKC